MLTPAHFLIQRPIFNPPLNPNYKPTSQTKRYDDLEKKAQRFWDSWLKDVLHTWSKRPKWQIIKKNLKVGHIVLIKGLHSKIQRWPLGVIEEPIPNHNGLVQKVKIVNDSLNYLIDAIPLKKGYNEMDCVVSSVLRPTTAQERKENNIYDVWAGYQPTS